jgi:hypothetical protein
MSLLKKVPEINMARPVLPVQRILGELDAKAKACEDTAKAWASVGSHQRASDYRDQAAIFRDLAAWLRQHSAGKGAP